MFKTIRPLVTFALLASCAALQAGCGARQIRAAQDAFNHGAQAENAERAATFSGGQPPLDAASAAASYHTALTLLDTELREHETDLQQENLLGTALMIKAMSLWRLADLESGGPLAPSRAALAEALNDAKSKAGAQLGTRDRVMAAALPGLYDHDLGLQATTLGEASERFSSAYRLLSEALQSETPPPNHPVRIYVWLAQLSTLRAYQSAIYRFGDPINPLNPPAELKDIHTCAKLVVLQMKPVLHDDPELQRFVEFVNTAIGIPSVASVTVPEGAQCRFDS
jgi:hypothetical protein